MIVLAIAQISILLIALLNRGERQPSYHGRPLSQLLIPFENDYEAAHVTEAEEFPLRCIGTNAVPWLLRWVSTEDSYSRSEALWMWNHRISEINSNWVLSDTIIDRQRRSRYGFKALGTNATFAVPALAKMLMSSNVGASLNSAYSLAYIGPPGWPVLFASLTNNFSDCLNGHLHDILEYLGTNATPAIPLLLRNLDDSDPEFRDDAAFLLGGVRVQPKVTIPALVKSLQDPDASVCQTAIYSLGQYGSEAMEAVPHLIPFLKNSDPETRSYAVDALKAICPKALTNAFGQRANSARQP